MPRKSPKTQAPSTRNQKLLNEAVTGEANRTDENSSFLVSRTEQQQESLPIPATSTRSSARELRRQHRDSLRSKSLGVGLTISTTPNNNGNDSTRKRIIFDDPGEDTNNEVRLSEMQDHGKDSIKSQSRQNLPTVAARSTGQQSREFNESKDGDRGNDDDDDGDDDDAVEEVKTSSAKKDIEDQMMKERESARNLNVLRRKSRKRKERPAPNKHEDSTEDDLDESFFEKLDAEMKDERNSSKKKVTADATTKNKARKITFVANDEGMTEKNVGHNLTVQVLGDDPRIIGSKPSKTALLFSRGIILSGTDELSEKQIRKAKKSGRDANNFIQTWTRSKKMNRFLLTGAKSKRGRAEGSAAASFVVNSR